MSFWMPARCCAAWIRRAVDDVSWKCIPHWAAHIARGDNPEGQGQWGKSTDDDIAVIDGKQDRLVGRVQEGCGIGVLCRLAGTRGMLASWKRNEVGCADSQDIQRLA